MDGPALVTERSVQGAAESRSTRPVMTRAPVQLYATGFKLSAYSDIKPAGTGITRKLWHSSPGSSGR
jgi:error-prone DNA polymerase